MMMSEAGHRREISEGFRLTTNNRMELLSVIVALESLKRPESTDVVVFSDSKYVVDAIEKAWVNKWERTGFKNKKNPDLWRRYLDLQKPRSLQFKWVKGHDGNVHNERCDRLAVEASKKESLLVDAEYERLNA